MIYKVINVDNVVTSTGKPMKKLGLESTDGAAQVNIFSDFPHFAEIIVGSTIDGELRKNDKGYTNLYSNEIKPRSGAGGAFKQVQIEKTMEVKAQHIEKAQTNKEEGIKIASTIRMAVDIVTSLKSDQWQATTMQEEIRFWREWLWLEWGKVGKDNMPPF